MSSLRRGALHKHSGDVTRLQALVDKKRIVITEEVVREILQLNDAGGVICLPNDEIFASLARMGYEKPSTKLTFYKAFFSTQWKFFIHMILHSLKEVANDVVPPTPTSPSPSSPVIPFTPPHQSPSPPQPQAVEGSSHLVQQVLDKCSALVLRVEGLENANAAQQLEIIKLKAMVKNLERLNKVKSSKLRRLKKVGTSQRVESSDDVENVFNQGRISVDMVTYEGVELVVDQEKDAEIEGRHGDKQAEIYNIDLDHSLKVLSMQKDTEVQEVVEVVTTTKLITEVVTAVATQVAAASTHIPTAKPKTLKIAAAALAVSTRRRKGVVIRDPKEELHTDTPVETPTVKDKGKGILIEDPKPMKKKDHVEMDVEYAKKLQEELNKEHEEAYKQIDWNAAFDHVQAKKTQFDANLKFLFKTREEMEKEDEEIIKSINETPAQKAAKRRKLSEEVQEANDLKKRLEIVQDEDDDVFVEAIPLTQKDPVVDYQTSNTLHNAIMEAIGKDRTSMLAPDKDVPVTKGSSKTTTERYMENYKNVSQDIHDQLTAEAKAVQIILIGTYNDIYSTVDVCPNACEMWKAIEMLKQGESINVQDLETNLYREFRKFTSWDGESLESYYSRFYKMMNELVRNQCDVTNHQVNVQSQQAATRNRGKAIVSSPPPIYDQEPSMVAEDDEMLKDKEIDKLIANQNNSPRINRGTGYDNQRIVNVARARENVTVDAADNSRPIFDTEPLQKVPNNDNYNVFTIESEHPVQSKSVHDTYLIEKDKHNVIIDSLDMSYDREHVDQDDADDLANEYDLLASLIEKLKCEIDDSKNHNKFLKTSNNALVDKLKGEIEDFKTKNKSLESSNNNFKEANNELSKTNKLMFKDLKKFEAELDRYNDVKYASKVETDCAKAKGDLMSYKMESEKSFNAYTQKINDLNQMISEMKKELFAHQETISILQSVQTMNMLNRNCKTSFAKPEFLKKAQRANPRLYNIGCYNDNLALMLAPESDEVIRLEKESRSKLSDLIRPFNYEKLNNLYDLFVPQREKSSAQRYFSERSKMSHTPVRNEHSKVSFSKQTTLLEKQMDESIPWDQKCKSSKELFKIKKSVAMIFDGVERCKQTIAKRTYFGHIDLFIQNTIEGNFCHEIQRINADLEKFHLCLKEEMVADLRYFNSLELKVYSLKSQLKTQKTQFLNEIDRLSREYYYVDHMNAILGVYTELDEVTNLQCDYLETLETCECLEKELSKSKMMSKSFEALQKHAINLELDLQQYLKAQLQDKGIAMSELKKLIEKLKGKSVETKFEKSSIIRQPNAFKSKRPSILGKPNIFSYSLEKKDCSKSKSVKKNNVSNDFSKSVTAQILLPNKKYILKNTNVLAPRMSNSPTSGSRPQLKRNQIEDIGMLNNSHRKKQEVKDHRRNVKVSKNKTSVTACNDSLNAKTSNLNFVCVTCGKCVLKDNHDMCVLHSLNGVNSKTKMPMVVPHSAREPKRILVEIILFIVDSGCSKHMTGNLRLLTNFVEKFMGTVKFGNDQIAPILGYGDLVQGIVTTKRVYYVEGLNHNLFSTSQFCDADLEVSFRKSKCYIRDLKENDLLIATSSQAWLWHRRLSHINFDTINLLLMNDIVIGLPKLKFIKDHLCCSYELGKAKRKPFQTKITPSSKRRLQLLHMDLCGPMRVESINGKKYVLVILYDYSRYTWTHFLRSKDKTHEVLIDFLKLVQRGLHAQVRTIQTDKGTEFLNKTLHTYFASEGINHQTSVARTPKQNGVVERQNRTLVEAAQTMLSAAKVPLDGENLDKMKEKVETIHVNFDELPQMASDHVSSDPVQQCPITALEHVSLSPGPQSQENVPQAVGTVTTSNELDLLFSPMFDELLNGYTQVVSKTSCGGPLLNGSLTLI
nr:retrovirus-related Pol polyprotein from transposon TNT 1-94 [Tanacetum cinerariifolium]